MLITEFGTILRTEVGGINRYRRASRGVTVMKPQEGDRIVSITVFVDEMAGPEVAEKVERRLREFKKPVQTMSKATEQVEKITQVGGGRQPQTVQVSTETLGERMFSRATELVAGGVVMFILLFFLLASGDLFLRKLIRVLPSLADKRRAVDIARQIETDISAYLVTITVINVALEVGQVGRVRPVGEDAAGVQGKGSQIGARRHLEAHEDLAGPVGVEVEAEIAPLADLQLQAKTVEFRQRLAAIRRG